jgi:hypothetical protein
MVEIINIESETLDDIAQAVARSLSYSRAAGDAAFITTAATYPNGSAVVVRIDGTPAGYFVSDDGYTALTAEMMDALPTFNKVVGPVVERTGLEYEQGSIGAMKVRREQLAGAVAHVATASVVAMERTLIALEQVKVRRSRTVFNERLREAFGSLIRFAAPVRGVTRGWDVDGAVVDGARVRAVFEFVPPAYSAVASAHMKLGDLRGLEEPPVTTAVLADYNDTEPSLRALLSQAADRVFGAIEPAERYTTSIST